MKPEPSAVSGAGQCGVTSPEPEAKAWFAVTVRPNHERTAAQALAAKGLEHFLPLYRAQRRWTDRVKQLDLPLFGGYVFCRFERREKARVLATPAVTSVVGFATSRRPSRVRDRVAQNAGGERSAVGALAIPSGGPEGVDRGRAAGGCQRGVGAGERRLARRGERRTAPAVGSGGGGPRRGGARGFGLARPCGSRGRGEVLLCRWLGRGRGW